MEYLAHHGIDGQKWGKRNGPPYPLNKSDYSSAEKKSLKKQSVTDAVKSASNSQLKKWAKGEESLDEVKTNIKARNSKELLSVAPYAGTISAIGAAATIFTGCPIPALLSSVYIAETGVLVGLGATTASKYKNLAIQSLNELDNRALNKYHEKYGKYFVNGDYDKIPNFKLPSSKYVDYNYGGGKLSSNAIKRDYANNLYRRKVGKQEKWNT